MSHGIFSSTSKLHQHSLRMLILSAAIAQASCAMRSAQPTAPEPLLEFENASTSPVHVYARVGASLIRVGWVAPGATGRLRLAVSPFSTLSLVVVPGERLADFRTFDGGPGVFTGEPYPRDTALSHRWRFSGNLLMAVPIPSRIGRP